jgi:hypothetical protein
LVNIKAIDFLHRNNTHAVGRARADNLRVKLLAYFRREPFRVIDNGEQKIRRKNHRGSHHRAGQRAASGLVNAGDELQTLFPKRGLEVKLVAGCGWPVAGGWWLGARARITISRFLKLCAR